MSSVKVFSIRAPRWLTTVIYLAMGWLCLMGIRVMLATMPMSALIWLLLGGIFFSLGAIVYVTKRPNFYPGVFGFHEALARLRHPRLSVPLRRRGCLCRPAHCV